MLRDSKGVLPLMSYTYLSAVDHLIFKLPYHFLFNNLNQYLDVYFDELPIQLEEFLKSIFNEQFRVNYSPNFSNNPFTYKKDFNFYPLTEGNPAPKLRRYGEIKYIQHVTNPKYTLSDGKVKPLPMIEFTFTGALLEHRQSSLIKLKSLLESINYSYIKEIDIAYDYPLDNRYSPDSLFENELMRKDNNDSSLFATIKSNPIIDLRQYDYSNTLYVNYDPTINKRGRKLAVRAYKKFELEKHRVELMLTQIKNCSPSFETLDSLSHLRIFLESFPNLFYYLHPEFQN